MTFQERQKMMKTVDYDNLVTLWADDLLRYGIKPIAVDYLTDMGAERIEYDSEADCIWYAGEPTGMTMAEYVKYTNEYDFCDM